MAELIIPYVWETTGSVIHFRASNKLDEILTIGDDGLGKAVLTLDQFLNTYKIGGMLEVTGTTNYNGTWEITDLNNPAPSVYNITITAPYVADETGDVQSYEAPLVKILWGATEVEKAAFQPDYYVQGNYFEFELQGWLASMFGNLKELPTTDADLVNFIWNSYKLHTVYKFGTLDTFETDPSPASYVVNSSITSENFNRYFVGVFQDGKRPPLLPLNFTHSCGDTIRVILNDDQDALIFDTVTGASAFTYKSKTDSEIW